MGVNGLKTKPCFHSLKLCFRWSKKINILAIDTVLTSDRRQSKTLLPSTNVGQKSLETYLSTDWRQMAIENTVSIDFEPRSSIVKSVFDCRLTGVAHVYFTLGGYYVGVIFVCFCEYMHL